MAEGRSYPREDGDIQFEDEFGGNVYFIMFTEFLYMCDCNFINILGILILFCLFWLVI